MMSADHRSTSGPDLRKGIPIDVVPDGGMLIGHVGGDAVLLARRADEVFATDALCTHYGAPLKDGLLVGDRVRCPWHHAEFCLRTGKVERAPALDAIGCWHVERRDGIVYVRERLDLGPPPPSPVPSGLRSILIVGGGAAGNAAAETLRKEGYAGRLAMVSADESLPCDRPNLSKGFLAGTAPDASNPLRSPQFYESQGIDVKLNARVAAIDTKARTARLADGSTFSYDALLLATGAEPTRLEVPGADLPHVHYLRTLADSRALVAKAQSSRRAVVIGASFIGLEAAAALRARDIEVHVVAPDGIPMERVLGVEIGMAIRRLHEEHGVKFHLGTVATSIDERSVTLRSGEVVAADFVVIGIGVRPALGLAEQAGLEVDRGVLVDRYLQTSVAGVFAAGDIARWPDRLTGENIRVEHWVVAERQGQIAALNILGRRVGFDCVPFFWTEQYDFSLAYIGHAEQWDKVDIDGSLEAKDCTVSYWRRGEKLAVAVIHRDREGLAAELELEQRMSKRTGRRAMADKVWMETARGKRPTRMTSPS
jgi:NADPH-dependent 2,4-dienoyl-CoA reductase/sulfur reductase-like enzyme/nitrite reductase/ring-hydroxylating ferredoxin subunit